jgi:hypothetical protein
MNINDFNGTIPDGRLNPPDEPDWGTPDSVCFKCKHFIMDSLVCVICSENYRSHYEPIPSPEGEPDDEKA